MQTFLDEDEKQTQQQMVKKLTFVSELFVIVSTACHGKIQKARKKINEVDNRQIEKQKIVCEALLFFLKESFLCIDWIMTEDKNRYIFRTADNYDLIQDTIRIDCKTELFWKETVYLVGSEGCHVP